MQNKGILEQYTEIAGLDVVEHLRQLAQPLKGLHIVHVNSTRVGGGVQPVAAVGRSVHDGILDEAQTEVGRVEHGAPALGVELGG